MWTARFVEVRLLSAALARERRRLDRSGGELRLVGLAQRDSSDAVRAAALLDRLTPLEQLTEVERRQHDPPSGSAPRGAATKDGRHSPVHVSIGGV